MDSLQSGVKRLVDKYYSGMKDVIAERKSDSEIGGLIIQTFLGDKRKLPLTVSQTLGYLLQTRTEKLRSAHFDEDVPSNYEYQWPVIPYELPESPGCFASYFPLGDKERLQDSEIDDIALALKQIYTSVLRTDVDVNVQGLQ